MQAPRQHPQASTDLSFFSKSRNTKSGTPVSRTVVTTRVVTTHKPPVAAKQPGAVDLLAREETPTPASEPAVSLPATPPPTRGTSRKRKVENDEAPLPTPSRKSKKPRLSTSPANSRASSLAPLLRNSTPSTRQSSLAPRGAGRSSRATSIAPPVPPPPPVPRDLWAEEDGRLTPDFVSSEEVVKNVMGSYKACKCSAVAPFYTRVT